MVSAVDDGVGRLLDKLNEHGLDERTLVFFLSDNGGADQQQLTEHAPAWPQEQPFEGGVGCRSRSGGPGRCPPASTTTTPSVHSTSPRRSSLGRGAEVPADKPLDGVDLVPYLTGDTQELPHPVLFWRWYDKHRYATRVGEQKLILMGDRQDDLGTREPILCCTTCGAT